MRRFHFKLESVRRLRLQEEQAIEVELATAMRERAAVQRRIDESRQAEAELYRYLREPGRTAAEMAHVAAFGTLHRQRIFDMGVKLRQFDKGVELVRRRLAVARARREGLDRLRDRQHQAWRLESLREEQAALDEVATMRAVRTRTELAAAGRAAAA